VERIKTELLMIGKEKGDTGTTAQQRQWIEYYMDALDQYLRPEGIQSFTAEQLRPPYEEFVKTYMVTGSLNEAREGVIQFFHTRRHLRDKPVNTAVNSSVVDIFKKRS
jgi:hypothetical protein